MIGIGLLVGTVGDSGFMTANCNAIAIVGTESEGHPLLFQHLNPRWLRHLLVWWCILDAPTPAGGGVR